MERRDPVEYRDAAEVAIEQDCWTPSGSVPHP
jgi:hypothetical protein